MSNWSASLHTAMAGDPNSEEDDDYMGDLSSFLPPEQIQPSSSTKKVPPPKPEPKRKNWKFSNWQEQRKADRNRKQKEEDDRTRAGMEAAIPPSNVGFKMLKLMGYSPGKALGKDGTGRAEPVGLEIRRSRAGIGKETPEEERARKDREMERRMREMEGRKRVREEDMMREFGSRQKTQWRSKRVGWDYQKAEAALARLENREVVEPEKEEEEKEEDEEEEPITEEDLLAILTKLREEHWYCLYCGCQYESAESLETNCPGLTEDDH